MQGYNVTTVLTDTYGEIRDTVISTPWPDVAYQTFDAKVEQYDGSLWDLIGQTDTSANYRHRESGATLLLAVERGPLPLATRH